MYTQLVLVAVLVLSDAALGETLSSKRDMFPESGKPVVTSDSLNMVFTGSVQTTRMNKKVYAYQGIPYTNGEPKRFERAEVATRSLRNQTFDATTPAEDVCPQVSRSGINYGEIIGDEDCLFLNVYIPKEREGLLPVMVYIHGGDFIRGGASAYNPTYLLDQDVLLVVIQYRLGALSFFTLEDPNYTLGNLALHDQKTALEWVHAYISDFGGDPERVTIFGQDSGAVSVNYHVLSENSNDFIGAIAQSGSAIDLLAFDEDPLNTSYELAKRVPNCDEVFSGTEDIDNAKLYICMKTANYTELAEAYDIWINEFNSTSGYPFAAPSIQNFEIAGRMVTQAPADALADPTIARVPMIIGTCAQEGSSIFGKMYSRYLAPTGKSEDPIYLQDDMVPELLEFTGVEDPTGIVAKSFQDFYLPGVTSGNFQDYCSGMIDMTGALYLKSGAQETASKHSRMTNIYMYSFEYEGRTNRFDNLRAENRTPCLPGVEHSDELMHLFKTPGRSSQGNDDVTDSMVTLWTNFAKHQNPTPDMPTWKPFTKEQPKYLIINSDLSLQDDFTTSWTVTADTMPVTDPVPSSTVAGPSPNSTDGWTSDMVPGQNSTTDAGTRPNSTDGWTTDMGPGQGSTTEIQCVVPDQLYQQYENLKHQRDAFLITMIIFIMLFIIATAIAVYCCTKNSR